MSVGRRGFLGGLIAAIAGSEAVIRLASPEETALVRVGDPARVLPPPEQVNPISQYGQIYIAVQGQDGMQFEAIGWLRDYSIANEVGALQVHGFDADIEQVIRGPRRLSMDASFHPIDTRGTLR